MDQTTELKRGGGMAIAALVLGIVGMLAWCAPCVGLPVTVTGLILGVLSLGGARHGMALAGVILCSLGLLIALAMAAVSAYLHAIGQALG